MKTPSLVAKSDFLGLDERIHLAGGGQTPNLASHVEVLRHFALTKGTGLKGQAENEMVRARAATRCAALLGCTPDDIGFPSSVAQAVGLLADSLDWRSGDNVVLEAWEFPSLINPWLVQRERGVEIRVLEPEERRASLERVRAAVDERTRVIALSHVSYLTGERHDLAAYSAIAREVGALLVVDSSHALGAVPVQAPLADFLFSCCYKWVLGIQGTAIAYWNRERLPDWRPRMTGWHSVTPRSPSQRRHGPDPLPDGRAFEPGNPTYAGIFVLDNALEYLSRQSSESIEQHDLELSGQVRNGLLDLGLDVTTPENPGERAGNLCFATTKAPAIRQAMEASNVLVTGEDERVRISTHIYNDSDDVSQGLELLAEVLKKAGDSSPCFC